MGLMDLAVAGVSVQSWHATIIFLDKPDMAQPLKPWPIVSSCDEIVSPEMGKKGFA